MAENENKPLVNIVDTLSEDVQVKIGLDIVTDYDNDIDARSSWEEKRNKWYKLWACVRDKKNTPWDNASNVCIPMLATACNQFHARSYQSIFAAPGMVKTLPVGKNDVKRAKNVEEFLNWQVMYDMEEYEEVFDELLQLLPINGTAFKKIHYDKDLERPISEYISALDVIIPYKTKRLDKARRIVHRIEMFYEEMQEHAESGIYSVKNFFKKVDETAAEEDNSELAKTAEEVTGIVPLRDDDKPHLVLECHKKLDLDLGDGVKPYIFTVDYDSHMLLRVTSRIYKVGNKEIELHHFIDYHFLPNPEGFYSFGFGHFLEQLNDMANTAFNQIFDSGSISNLPFGFYGRRAGVTKKKLKIHPGGMYEVDDVKQIYFPSMQRVDQVLFQVLGVTQQYSEMFTSTSEYLTGRESKGTKTPTAHGTLAIIEQGLVTFAVITKRVFRSLRKELRFLSLLDQIYLPDEKEYMVMESEENIAFPDFKKSDLDGKFHYIPIGDPSYASKETRRREAFEIYELSMGNPLITGNPEIGLPPNIPAMHEVFSTLLDAYQAKNKNKILPSLPDVPIPPEQENAMFMQGDYTEPKQGENHGRHIQVHTEFMISPFYKKEYDELMKKHLEATQQIAYLEQAQKLALGGGPQGGVSQGGGQQNV